MEVEMKAKLNDEQFGKILDEYIRKVCCTLLIKKDEYFSLGGRFLENPKEVIRLREESNYKCLFEPVNFEVPEGVEPASSYTLFTIKNKNTNELGVEVNVEKECKLEKAQADVVRKLLKAVAYEPYFLKNKVSYSFYIEDNMHAELEIIKGLDKCTPIYLEIESVVGDSEKEIEEAQEKIIKFFNSFLGINEFDKRSWNQILSE